MCIRDRAKAGTVPPKPSKTRLPAASAAAAAVEGEESSSSEESEPPPLSEEVTETAGPKKGSGTRLGGTRLKIPPDLTPYDPKLPYWLVPPQTNIHNTPKPPPLENFFKPNNRPGTKHTRRLIWMYNSGRYKLGDEESNSCLLYTSPSPRDS